MPDNAETATYIGAFAVAYAFGVIPDPASAGEGSAVPCLTLTLSVSFAANVIVRNIRPGFSKHFAFASSNPKPTYAFANAKA
jgi:hypothetical protein